MTDNIMTIAKTIARSQSRLAYLKKKEITLKEQQLLLGTCAYMLYAFVHGCEDKAAEMYDEIFDDFYKKDTIH